MLPHTRSWSSAPGECLPSWASTELGRCSWIWFSLNIGLCAQARPAEHPANLASSSCAHTASQPLLDLFTGLLQAASRQHGLLLNNQP